MNAATSADGPAALSGLRVFGYRVDEAAMNMAIDQAILQSVAEDSVATLRFYGWTRPTLSLGYFQKLQDRSIHPGSKSLVCVRRASGGGAIVHDGELTYSFVCPTEPGELGTRRDLYQWVHASVIGVLREFGVAAEPVGQSSDCLCSRFLCFRRRTEDDLTVSGYKIVGSAQRRGKAGILQHGSILLRSSAYAVELPGVAELTGRSISPEQLAQRWLLRWRERHHWDLQVGTISTPLMERARCIAAERFANESWLSRR